MPFTISGSLYFALQLVELLPVEPLLVARGVRLARRRGLIALGDVALAAAVVMGVDGEAERAEAGRRPRGRRTSRPRRGRRARKAGKSSAHSGWTLPVSSISGLATELWNMAQPNVPAASATAAQARLIEPLDAADRGQRHRHLQGAAEELAAGVGAVDVAQDARPERRANRSPGGCGAPWSRSRRRRSDSPRRCGRAWRAPPRRSRANSESDPGPGPFPTPDCGAHRASWSACRQAGCHAKAAI